MRQRINIIVGTILLTAAAVFSAFPQGRELVKEKLKITSEVRKAAAEAFAAKDWKKAAGSYGSIAEAEPENSGALYRLGFSLYSLKEYDRAMSAFQSSEKLGPNPTVQYNLACLFSLKGDKSAAFEWLDKAIAWGSTTLNSIEADPDLASLQGDSRFMALGDKIEKAMNPCKYDPMARQFDFWIGNWNVKNPAGQTAGTNNVLLLEKGCIVEENWIGTYGGTGRSFNFYDKQAKKWRQVWIDSSGNSTLFTGELRDGALVYLSDKIGPDKKPYIIRLTFTPMDGKVRQHAERSSDGGSTWQTTYDFMYEKKP